MIVRKMMSNPTPTAIDFVGMYANRIEEEEEFDQVDDMLKAAAVLVVKADETLDGMLPKESDDEVIE